MFGWKPGYCGVPFKSQSAVYSRYVHICVINRVKVHEMETDSKVLEVVSWSVSVTPLTITSACHSAGWAFIFTEADVTAVREAFKAPCIVGLWAVWDERWKSWEKCGKTSPGLSEGRGPVYISGFGPTVTEDSAPGSTTVWRGVRHVRSTKYTASKAWTDTLLVFWIKKPTLTL